MSDQPMGKGNWTYPDSVNRVRPPKTTIPKTLAADPNSQYATPFEDVFGKKPFVATTFSFSAFDIVLLKEVKGEFLIVFASGNAAALLLNRMVRLRFAFTGSLRRPKGRDCLRHW
jgi:hypothetical protein